MIVGAVVVARISPNVSNEPPKWRTLQVKEQMVCEAHISMDTLNIVFSVIGSFMPLVITFLMTSLINKLRSTIITTYFELIMKCQLLKQTLVYFG